MARDLNRWWLHFRFLCGCRVFWVKLSQRCNRGKSAEGSTNDRPTAMRVSMNICKALQITDKYLGPILSRATGKVIPTGSLSKWSSD